MPVSHPPGNPHLENAMPRRHLLLLSAAIAALFLAAAPVQAAEPATAKVAHIKLKGDLDETPVAVDPLFNLGGENFRDKLERIKKAGKDKEIAALYLQLESLE